MLKEFKLARGVFFRQINHDQTVLLIKDNHPDKKYFFLPGGQVQPGHSMTQSLTQTCEQQIGLKIAPHQFLGCIEHQWSSTSQKLDNEEQVQVYELNFLFKIVLTEKEDLHPHTKNQNHSFHWVPLKDLLRYNLHPAPLKSIILEYHFKQYHSIWVSTIK